MRTADYERVIAQMCDATGLPRWARNERVHLDVEGATVGLIHDDTVAPDCLYLFVDLGAFGHPDLHRSLLVDNLAIEPAAEGYYAMLPDSGSVVYRSRLMLTQDYDGASLPQHLVTLVATARERLQSLLEP